MIWNENLSLRYAYPDRQGASRILPQRAEVTPKSWNKYPTREAVINEWE